jgi:hypothetical protein
MPKYVVEFCCIIIFIIKLAFCRGVTYGAIYLSYWGGGGEYPSKLNTNSFLNHSFVNVSSHIIVKNMWYGQN